MDGWSHPRAEFRCRRGSVVLNRRAALAASTALLVGFPAQSRAALRTPAVVTVGVNPSDAAAIAFYAKDLGYFSRAGLDVRLSVLQNGPTIAAAVIGATLDIGAGNVGSIASARLRGFPLCFIAPAAIGLPGDATPEVIMVRKDSPIKSAADLTGKTIGIVAIKTAQHANFLLWIDKNGGDSKTVKMTELPFPSMMGALEAGRVDAALPTEPYVSQARAGNRVIGNVLTSISSPVLLIGFFATETWLRSSPDTAARFASAILAAASWANAHPRESAAVLTKYTNIDPHVAAVMERAVYGTALSTSMLQPAIDNEVAYGMLDRGVDASEMIWHR